MSCGLRIVPSAKPDHANPQKGPLRQRTENDGFLATCDLLCTAILKAMSFDLLILELCESERRRHKSQNELSLEMRLQFENLVAHYHIQNIRERSATA
jgi:hypothetical protein